MVIDFKILNISALVPKSAFEESLKSFLMAWASAGDSVEVSTSGSTGTPKVLHVSKAKMRNSANMTCDFLGLEPGDLALLCLPIEYISGKMMVVRSMERGMKLLVTDSTTTPLEALDQQVDFCAMTPLQVERSLSKIHLIKNLIIGGAGVSESLQIKLKQTLDLAKQKGNSTQVRIFETYGMSETLSHIALKQLYPNPAQTFTVFDGVEISKDARGALRIEAPKLSSEVLQTNDLVELRGEKEFKFLGRTDNVINSGGAKIRPEELESLVKRQIPYEVVFLGMKDAVLGEKLILVVEGQESSSLLEAIDAVIYEKNFHRPKTVLFIEKIPRTPNGKISRPLLRKWLDEQTV